MNIFNTEHLHKIIKMSGLSHKIYIYASNNNPIVFKTNIGSLGEISIFLKSNLQMNSSQED